MLASDLDCTVRRKGNEETMKRMKVENTCDGSLFLNAALQGTEIYKSKVSLHKCGSMFHMGDLLCQWKAVRGRQDVHESLVRSQ